MNLTSRLKPDSAVTVGLATAAAIYGIYSYSVPNMTDVRAAPPHDMDVESARKAAAGKSAALIGLVFLITHDLNSFILSGASLVGIDYFTKHSNAIHPATGKLDASNGGQTIAPGLAVAPDADADDDGYAA